MSRLKFSHVLSSVDPCMALEHAVFAEKSGFDAVWVPDHFVDINGDRLEPWSVLSAIAVRTKKIELSSVVTDTQRNHPARIAHVVACVDTLAGGRTILGIGAGESMNIVPFGLPWESARVRVDRLEEAIHVIRLLWKSSRDQLANFNGKYYRLENAFLSQSPKRKPAPPIFIGAFSSKRAIQAVGKYGDGWYSWLNTPSSFRRRWAIVRESAESVGRSIREIEPSSNVMVAFPKKTSELKSAMISAKIILVMERSILATFDYISPVDQYQHLRVLKEDVSKVTAAAGTVPDDIVYETMAVGGAHEVEEKIERLAKAGVKNFGVVDLLAPDKARLTLKSLGKIIRHYR